MSAPAFLRVIVLPGNNGCLRSYIGAIAQPEHRVVLASPFLQTILSRSVHHTDQCVAIPNRNAADVLLRIFSRSRC